MTERFPQNWGVNNSQEFSVEIPIMNSSQKLKSRDKEQQRMRQTIHQMIVSGRNPEEIVIEGQ